MENYWNILLLGMSWLVLKCYLFPLHVYLLSVRFGVWECYISHGRWSIIRFRSILFLANNQFYTRSRCFKFVYASTYLP